MGWARVFPLAFLSFILPSFILFSFFLLSFLSFVLFSLKLPLSFPFPEVIFILFFFLHFFPLFFFGRSQKLVSLDSGSKIVDLPETLLVSSRRLSSGAQHDTTTWDHTALVSLFDSTHSPPTAFVNGAVLSAAPFDR